MTLHHQKKNGLLLFGISVDKLLAATLYINTVINPNVFHNSYLKSLQLPILQSNISFLDHDSYIDCSHIYEKETASLKKFLTENLDGLKGALPTKYLSDVLGKIKVSKTIQPKIKKKYNLI